LSGPPERHLNHAGSSWQTGTRVPCSITIEGTWGTGVFKKANGRTKGLDFWTRASENRTWSSDVYTLLVEVDEKNFVVKKVGKRSQMNRNKPSQRGALRRTVDTLQRMWNNHSEAREKLVERDRLGEPRDPVVKTGKRKRGGKRKGRLDAGHTSVLRETSATHPWGTHMVKVVR